jgi:Protein of unknown function (DUF3014)
MSEKNKDWFLIGSIGAGVLLVAGGIGLYLLRDSGPAPEPAAAVSPPVETTPPPPPPVTTTPPPRALPLPPLDESDADVQGGLTELFGQDAVKRFLVPERLVRNIVVTIDNAPRQQMAVNQRPIKPTPGELITTGPEDARVLAPENYARYAPFVALVRTIDAKTLVSLYRGLQPLFQQAYEELGHPNQAFNARLIEVIEHLLATPNVRDEIRLVQPSVQYRYADERLEKLSAGQKLLIRMGPENAAVIKAKLREIQAELV